MFRLEIEANTPDGLVYKLKEYIGHFNANQCNDVPVKEQTQLPIVEVEQIQTPFKVEAPVVAPPVVAPPWARSVQAPSGVDSRGIKWDERIHSSSGHKNSNGTWRTRRNIDESLIKKVEAELQVTPSPVGAPVVPPPAPQQVMAPPPPMPSAPTPGGHTLVSFKNNLLSVIAQLVKEKKIDQDYIEALNKYFEVDELWQIFSDDSKVSELFENFAASGLVVKVG